MRHCLSTFALRYSHYLPRVPHDCIISFKYINQSSRNCRYRVTSLTRNTELRIHASEIDVPTRSFRNVPSLRLEQLPTRSSPNIRRINLRKEIGITDVEQRSRIEHDFNGQNQKKRRGGMQITRGTRLRSLFPGTQGAENSAAKASPVH